MNRSPDAGLGDGHIRISPHYVAFEPPPNAPDAPLPPALPPPAPADEKPPVRVGGRLEPAVLIKRTEPQYPPMAKAARVEGVVVLKGMISLDGRIDDIRVVSGNPVLVDAAVQCVRKWKYRPAVLNGQPIAAPIEISVGFRLIYPGGR
jgi:protein TonB